MRRIQPESIAQQLEDMSLEDLNSIAGAVTAAYIRIEKHAKAVYDAHHKRVHGVKVKWCRYWYPGSEKPAKTEPLSADEIANLRRQFFCVEVLSQTGVE